MRNKRISRNKPQLTIFIIIGALVLSNLITYWYFSYKLNHLREQSPFIPVATKENVSDGGLTLRSCLDKHKIENKMDNGNVLVRQVDLNAALKKCS